MLISFELTMPNVGSWNGKWTGADKKYYIIKNVSTSYVKKQVFFKKLLEKKTDNWYYRWNDGWGANVEAEIVDAAEAHKRRKMSKGFAGYDWMVQSIISYGIIESDTEQQKIL
jgi:hypothetical protein